LLQLQRKLLNAEAENYEEKKDYGNALSRQFDVAKIGLQINWEWVISDALKDIERILGKGGKFDPDEIREVTQFLKKLPPEYEPLVKGVQSKL
jgi:ubiquinone/menaquinone biosynthesis C-methylase UbiE